MIHCLNVAKEFCVYLFLAGEGRTETLGNTEWMNAYTQVKILDAGDSYVHTPVGGRECSILWQGRVWSRREFTPKAALESNPTCRDSILPAEQFSALRPNGITKHRRTPILQITRLMAKNHKAGNELPELQSAFTEWEWAPHPHVRNSVESPRRILTLWEYLTAACDCVTSSNKES